MTVRCPMCGATVDLPDLPRSRTQCPGCKNFLCVDMGELGRAHEDLQDGEDE